MGVCVLRNVDMFPDIIDQFALDKKRFEWFQRFQRSKMSKRFIRSKKSKISDRSKRLR